MATGGDFRTAIDIPSWVAIDLPEWVARPEGFEPPTL
jgi:hypothetical protein